MVEFNYKAVKRANSVVVLGAGPSLTTNIGKIKRYIIQNNSIVISSNYNFADLGLNAHYTYVTDEEKLMVNARKIDTPLIVAAAIINYKTLRFLRAFRKRTGLPVYKMGRHGGPHVYDGKGLIFMDSTGAFVNKSLGIAGLGAIVSAIVFKPKKMLIVGIDDPTPGKDFKIMYDGKRVNYTKKKKCTKVVNYFASRVVPTLRAKKIVVDTFADVNFFGLSKKGLKFNIIQ